MEDMEMGAGLPAWLTTGVGMLGWMLVVHHTENMPATGDIRFTFLMQVGLVLGTVTALPAMRLLIARGIKPVT